MKKIIFLKRVFDFLFIAGIIGLSIGVLTMTISQFREFTFNFLDSVFGKANEEIVNIESINWSSTLVFAGYVAYLLVLKLFSKLIKQFIDNDFFSLKSIHYFKLIGYCFIISGILTRVPPKLFDYFSMPRIVKYEFPIGYDSFIFIIAIGLFFIALSEIFKMAIDMKQENDLTI
jgi:hypothetical protein